MNSNFCNPFRVIAGGKALVWGVVFIAAAVALLCCGGLVQDSYIHFGLRADGVRVWQGATMQVLLWLIPALLLYGCGVAMSRSKIRAIDMLGTTAFAQLLLLPMIAPLLLFDMTQSTPAPAWAMMLFAVWALVWLVLFFVWNYSAFSLSCNVRGAKAIVAFALVQALLVCFSGLLGRVIL